MTAGEMVREWRAHAETCPTCQNASKRLMCAPAGTASPPVAVGTTVVVKTPEALRSRLSDRPQPCPTGAERKRRGAALAQACGTVLLLVLTALPRPTHPRRHGRPTGRTADAALGVAPLSPGVGSDGRRGRGGVFEQENSWRS